MTFKGADKIEPVGEIQAELSCSPQCYSALGQCLVYLDNTVRRPCLGSLGLGAASVAVPGELGFSWALVKSDKCGVLGAILTSTLLSSVPQILEALCPALLLCNTGGARTSVTSLLWFLQLRYGKVALKVISGEASGSVGS